MKQILTLLAALTCLCAGIAAAGLSDSETLAGVPNPIREYTSISELEKAVGFPVSAPEEIHGFRLTAVSSIDSLAQLIYSDCAQELCFRVSPAARTEGDNSGDYNHYDFARSEEIDSAAVTMKGFGDTVSLASWQRNQYDYSIGVRSAGVAPETMSELVRAFGF